MKKEEQKYKHTQESARRDVPANREPLDRAPQKNKAPLLDLEPNSSTTIPVIEEELRIQKRTIETGSLDISKKVTEEDITVEVPYVEEELDVERIAINQYVDTPPPPMRTEGDTTIIPVLKEVVVKRLVLVEEVHITKRKKKQQLTEDMTLRKEEVHVKRNSPTPPNQGQA